MRKPQCRTPSAQQQAFVDEFLRNGGRPSTAARTVYGPGADSNSDKLMASRTIQRAIEKGRAALNEKNVMSQTEVLKTLAGIARSGEAKDTDRISACREINEMLGFHAPAKSQVAVSGVATITELMHIAMQITAPERPRLPQIRAVAVLPTQPAAHGALDAPKARQDAPGTTNGGDHAPR